MGRRSKVSALPNAVKQWLDAALVEGNFSGYEQLEAELKARGFDIGKSSIQRYGSQFEQKLGALKMASEQARAIVSAAPDDEGAVSEALMRLVQENLFKMLVEFVPEPGQALNMPRIAKAVAEMSRATVTQKKWQEEVRARAAAVAESAEKIARKGGLSAASVDEIRRSILGIAT